MTATDHVMRLLARGVPLSLLCDLAEANGPESYAIYLDEPAPGFDPAGAAADPDEGNRRLRTAL